MILVSGVLLAACKPAETTVVLEATPTPLVSPTSAAEASSTRAFVVSGENFSFDVKEIKVKQGDTVKIVFKNLEGFHDLRIDEFNVFTKQIGANQEDTISFVVDRTGVFEYYCSVGQHRAMGMVGKLVVE